MDKTKFKFRTRRHPSLKCDAKPRVYSHIVCRSRYCLLCINLPFVILISENGTPPSNHVDPGSRPQLTYIDRRSHDPHIIGQTKPPTMEKHDPSPMGEVAGLEGPSYMLVIMHTLTTLYFMEGEHKEETLSVFE